MTSPLIARQTNYLKNNVPYYKYYQSSDVNADSEELFSSATAQVGGEDCYAPAYSFKGSGTSSGNFPSSGSGMTTSIITPSSYNNTSVTLSAWVKPTQTGMTSRSIWGCHADNTASGISFGIDDQASYSNCIKFHAISYGGVLRSTTKLSANVWSFIVCVYDVTNHQMRIYINGSLNASQSIPTSLTGTAYELKFGYYIWKAGFWSGNGSTSKTSSQSAGQCFLGNIINACTWYRALSQSEITTLYNNGAGLKINTNIAPYNDGLAIAYPMNETSGNIAYSAISGQDTGLYGSSTSYNQHVQDSVFAGSGVAPENIYISGGTNWETDLPVSASADFVSELTLERSIIPTKITLTFDNVTPKNPQILTINASVNGYYWEELTTIEISDNINQVIEQNIDSSTAYMYYQIYSDSAYTNTGLTINNVKIDGYYIVTTEVGQHSIWDTQELAGTHTVISDDENYDEIEYQNKEYEVKNV